MKPLAWMASLLYLSGMVAGPAATPPQQPTFRSSAEIVVVDVAVLGRDGTPVRDLDAGDFSVTVDGRPRRIASAQFIDESSRQTPSSSGLLPVSSNTGGGAGRLVVIVVDESTIRFGGVRPAMQSIEHLLAGFGPSDRIALATLPGPRMLVEFGLDRQRIIAAAKRIVGGAGPSQSVLPTRVAVSEAFAIDRGIARVLETVVARECRTARDESRQNCQVEVEMTARQVVSQARNQVFEFVGGLRSLLRSLRSLDVPKIVVLFSEGLASPETSTELAPLAYEAAEAHAVIYAMRLDPSMVDAADRNPGGFFSEDRDLGRASLETLAGGSRGIMLEIAGSSEIPFDRFAREVSGYYLLGLDPEDTDRDGKPHRIQVATGRAGVTVRARREFTVAPVKTVDESTLLVETLKSPGIATGVPLRATTMNMADEDPRKVRVMVVAEVGREHEKGGLARARYIIYDERGNVVSGSSERRDLELTPSGALRFVEVTVVPEGRYTLKIAAVRDRRAGSVEHPVNARLTRAAPLLVGDLLVRNPVGRDERFAPSVDAVVSGDAIMGFVQMRADRDIPRGAAFSFEIARQDNGPGLVSAPALVAPSRSSVRTAQAVVDARLLPPGQYAARLAVSVAGKPIGAVSTRFSLERTTERAVARMGSIAGADVPPFQLADVLAPAALAPILDDLTESASPAVVAAIERAKEGRFDEAARQARADSGDDARPSFLRGLALLGAGQLQAASQAFRDATRADPEFLLGVFFIGACYGAGGRSQEAINAWQTSLISLDRYPLVYRVLTDALMRNGQPDRAAELLDEALARWPDDDTLQSRMARAAFDAGRYQRVWESVDRLASRRPVEPALLFLAMGAVFQVAVDSDAPPRELLARLERYSDLYAAAGGPRQPLVGEWVTYVQRKVKQ